MCDEMVVSNILVMGGSRGGSMGSSMQAAGGKTRHRRLAPEGEHGNPATFNILVMEVRQAGFGANPPSSPWLNPCLPWSTVTTATCGTHSGAVHSGAVRSGAVHSGAVHFTGSCLLTTTLSPHALSHLPPRSLPYTPPSSQYCDRGNLRDAVKSDTFHRKLPGGAIGVDLAAVIEVLLDVTCALQFLHDTCLVHGDVKVRLPIGGCRV